jgi:biotin operon repressor
MLLTLLGGVPQSGSALAEAAGISRSLASAHLKKQDGLTYWDRGVRRSSAVRHRG